MKKRFFCLFLALMMALPMALALADGDVTLTVLWFNDANEPTSPTCSWTPSPIISPIIPT